MTDHSVALAWQEVENAVQYAIYWGTLAEFQPDDSTFVTQVEPGIYRVGRYEDSGLKVHTRYYYRVRAIDRDGHAGTFSDEFSAITREE